MKRVYITPKSKIVIVRHSEILTGSRDSIGVSTGPESLNGDEALVNGRYYDW